MSGLRLPLAASIAGHAIVLFLLIWLSARLPPLTLLPSAPNAVAVIFAPPPPPAPPTPQPPAPQPVVVKPPPPPPPPPRPKVVEAPKPPPVIRHIEQKPKPRPLPRREVRRRIIRPLRREMPRRPEAVERPLRAIPPRYAPPQTAALPPVPAPIRRPAPAAPIVSADYRDALAAWFAAHKHYPESARDRGEQGEGLLRFKVDRYGRVLTYTLVRSTGYADLDAAIEAMMRGAELPPFPSGMAAEDIEVTMPFSFHLER
ncbi:MAG TPA: TonB family protein [Stellaceae bacterium]|nr:TonB family protein [Stellaceae bacterium]